MGTRHLIAVFTDGEYKVAQYGQWDGYPGGQGADILEFLKEVNLPEFRRKVRKSRFVNDEELQQLWEEAGADPKDNWVSMAVSEKFSEAHPQLSRDAGARVLTMIQQQPDGLRLKNSIKFAGDSLMCEWAYVIDLDNFRLEVYKGFNQRPLDESDRFYSSTGSSGCEPVKIVDWWPLDALPEKDVFIAALDPEDNEG